MFSEITNLFNYNLFLENKVRLLDITSVFRYVVFRKQKYALIS